MQSMQEKFLEEAYELISDLENAVLSLENEKENTAGIEEVFRIMHTFKGTAKMFGFDRIGEFTHFLENIFDHILRGTLAVNEEIFNMTFQSVDHIRALLASNENQTPALLDQHQRLLHKVQQISQAVTGTNEQATSAAAEPSGLFLIHFHPYADFLHSGNNPLFLIEDVTSLGTYWVQTVSENLPESTHFEPETTYLRWNILLYTDKTASSIQEEFLFVEDHCDLQIHYLGNRNLLEEASFLDEIKGWPTALTAEAITARFLPAQPLRASAQVANTTQTIKVTYDKVDKLMGLISELVTTQAHLSLFSENLKHPELVEITEDVEKLVRMLRDEAFSISLIPISYLSVRFERLIRDTSKALNKKVRFVTQGDDAELDKKIIDNLADPLLHIFRNALDHGLESPELRKKAGKEETGTICLKSYYSGPSVILEISDDGAGIDTEIVRKKAIQKGLVSNEDELSDKEITDLIFHPGFSTTEKITDVSGRGVGMDVVSKAIKALRGEILIDTQKGSGTTFRIKLPLSLSIIDGLLVSIGQSNYILPLSAIVKCFEIPYDSLVHNLNDIIVLDGKQIPFIHLRERFEIQTTAPQYIHMIVVKHENQHVALSVDHIIDEYQAVLKPLGSMYKNQDFASGGTILGDGTVALVLDTNRLIAWAKEDSQFA